MNPDALPAITATGQPKRPFTLTILSALLILRALLVISLTGFLIYGTAISPASTNAAQLELLLLEVLLLVTGLVMFVAAIGLWRLAPWAWPVNMVIMGFTLIVGLWQHYNHDYPLINHLGMLLNITIVFYLVQGDIRSLFVDTDAEKKPA
jgi:hypothetical protein